MSDNVHLYRQPAPQQTDHSHALEAHSVLTADVPSDRDPSLRLLGAEYYHNNESSTLSIPAMKIGAVKKESQTVFGGSIIYHFVLISTIDRSTLRWYEKALVNAPFGKDEKGCINLKKAKISISGQYITIHDAADESLRLVFSSNNMAEQGLWYGAISKHIIYASRPPLLKAGLLQIEPRAFFGGSNIHQFVLSSKFSLKLDESMLKWYERALKVSPYGDREKGSLNLRNAKLSVHGRNLKLINSSGEELTLLFADEQRDQQKDWFDTLSAHISFANWKESDGVSQHLDNVSFLNSNIASLHEKSTGSQDDKIMSNSQQPLNGARNPSEQQKSTNTHIKAVYNRLNYKKVPTSNPGPLVETENKTKNSMDFVPKTKSGFGSSQAGEANNVSARISEGSQNLTQKGSSSVDILEMAESSNKKSVSAEQASSIIFNKNSSVSANSQIPEPKHASKTIVSTQSPSQKLMRSQSVTSGRRISHRTTNGLTTSINAKAKIKLPYSASSALDEAESGIKLNVETPKSVTLETTSSSVLGNNIKRREMNYLNVPTKVIQNSSKNEISDILLKRSSTDPGISAKSVTKDAKFAKALLRYPQLVLYLKPGSRKEGELFKRNHRLVKQSSGLISSFNIFSSDWNKKYFCLDFETCTVSYSVAALKRCNFHE